MKITGIIAECNPFHEGHAYLLQKAKEITDADYTIVAISGDYVQRGAPSIIGWERRTMALLRGGADLVVQLPLYTSCTGADYFARGSVSLLSSLGVVTDLCFGSECGDITELKSAADTLLDITDEQNETIRSLLRQGQTYASARAKALSGEKVTMPNTANDLLAVEYLKALRATESSMTPHAIKRIKCDSASDLRAKILHSDAPLGDKTSFPAVTSEQFLSDEGCLPVISTNDFSGELLHSLLYRSTDGDRSLLSGYLDVSEDLANRIASTLSAFESFDSYCSLLKNRSVTYTRVSRALMHILLEMTDAKMEQFQSIGMCEYVRPLGFKRSAAPLLHAISENASVPFLSKLSKAKTLLDPVALSFLEQDLRAEYLYDLTAYRKAMHTNSGCIPQTMPQVKHPLMKRHIII